MTPRDRCDILKDEVHGYIRFSHRPTGAGASERDLIDSPWVQRLRRIRQLQAAWYVYPSADHTRFIHSLAVMELAGRFARHVYRPFWEQADNSTKEAIPSVPLVVETLRVAGLLHDVGHLPFSHLADEVFLKKRFELTHETLGAHIVRVHLADIIQGINSTPDGEALEAPVDPEIICRLIASGQEDDLPMVWKALSSILRGSWDADKMDFILRDGRSLGLEGISPHEVERLMLTSFVYPEQGATPVFCLDSTSLPALIAFLRQRQYLTTVAYHHRTVRAFEEQLRPELEAALTELLPGDPRECPDSLLACDEDSVHHVLRRDQNGAWSRLQRRELDWKLAYETKIPEEQTNGSNESTNDVIRYLEEAGIPASEFMVDVKPYYAPKALNNAVYVLDRGTRKLRRLSPSDFCTGGIDIYCEFMKVYVRSARTDLVLPVESVLVARFRANTTDRALRPEGLLTSW